MSKNVTLGWGTPFTYSRLVYAGPLKYLYVLPGLSGIFTPLCKKNAIFKKEVDNCVEPSMYVIIVGGGRTGSALAQRLSERGHNVVVIERDERRAHELAGRLNALVIHGNGAELDVLKDAGLKKADALVALTDADEVNLMACEIAKKQGVPLVIARVNDDAHAEMFESIGIDVAISVPTTLSMLFEKVLLGGSGVYGLLSIGGGKGEVIEVKVGPTSKAAGKSLSELKLKDVVVATISRGDELIIPKGDTVIQPGDLVALVGYRQAIIKAAKFFKGD